MYESLRAKWFFIQMEKNIVLSLNEKLHVLIMGKLCSGKIKNKINKYIIYDI